MVLAVGEVAISAIGGMGWEDIGFVAAGVLNYDMSSLHIVCLVSFTVAGIGVSSLWFDVCVWGVALG